MTSIFDRGFKYVPSLETDVRRTFARIRRQQSSKKTRSSFEGAKDVVNQTSRQGRGKELVHSD